MTAGESLSLPIGIRERYRDVVSDRWLVIVTPQHDELLSSWLHRLAYANGIAPQPFARVLGLNAGMWSASLDLKLPADVENLLRAHTGISPRRLSAMMLARSSLKPLLLPLRSSGRRDSSTWLQFCPRCLAEDAQPYFRRNGGWRPKLHAPRIVADCATVAHPAAAALRLSTRPNSFHSTIASVVVSIFAAHRKSR